MHDPIIDRPLNEIERERIAKLLKERYLPDVNRNVPIPKPNVSFYTRYGKRICDIAFSALALIVTLPINVALAICTYLDVGRPIFFKQRRAGLRGREFSMVKFRNMTNDKDEEGRLLPAKERVTKFGKVVRGTSLDELLNFWNILKGDMSLIGPRPLLPEYTNRYSERHFARLSVRPGLECPPLHFDAANGSWDAQFEHDVWYVENVSLKTDLKMMGAILKLATNRKRTDERASALRGYFLGYGPDGKAVESNNLSTQYETEENRKRATDGDLEVDHAFS